jgi:hypothetical protein
MQIRNLLAAALLCSMTVAAVPAMAATHDTAKKPTTTTLTGSTHSLDKGQKGTLTVKVTPNPMHGAVTLFYKEGSNGKRTLYGTESLSGGGVVVFHKTAGDPGSYSIQAVYDGSGSYKSSTSNTWKVTVHP